MKVSIVMSVMVSGRSTQTNLDAHFDLREDLVGLGFEPVPAMGSYKGELELSYVIPCKLSDLQKFTSIAYEYEQECILVVEANTLDCRFITTTGGNNEMFCDLPVAGKWSKVNVDDLDSEDNFTKVGEVFYQIK